MAPARLLRHLPELTRSTDVDELAELGDVLVVMPEAGEVGFYTNWYNGGRKGPPRWETFHLTELRRLLERDWRTGDRRVIAGLSMGGLGAMAYAARHPGMFRAAASYSGLRHTRYQGGPVPGPQVIQDLLGTFAQDPYALWGDPRDIATAGPGTTPTTLRPGCAASAYSSRSATGNPAHSTGRQPRSRHSGSSGPSIRRTWRSSSGWDSSASPLGSTPTARAPTPGPTGSGELYRSLPLLLDGL